MITPFPMTSDNAATIFSRLGVRFDLVYVDAAHEYESAKRDIMVARRTRAANDFASENQVPIVGMDDKFIMAKGKTRADAIFNRL